MDGLGEKTDRRDPQGSPVGVQQTESICRRTVPTLALALFPEHGCG